MSGVHDDDDAHSDRASGKIYDAVLVRKLARFFVPHKWLLVRALFTYPAAAVLQLAQPYLVKVAIDDHLVPRRSEGFWTVALLLIGVIALEFAVKFYQTIATQLLGQRVTRDLRLALFDKLQRADLAFIERNMVGRLMTRVTNDVESLSETFSTGAISIVGDIVTLAGIVIMMFVLDVQMTLFAFAVLPLLAGFVLYMRRYIRDSFRRIRSLLAKINAFLGEAISGVSVIQVFGKERAMEREFDDINAAYRDANFRAIAYDSTTYAVVEAVATIAIASIIVLGLHLFERGLVEIGLFIAFIEYVRRFFQPITELSTKYTMLQSAMVSAERCVDLLEERPGIVDPVEPVALRAFRDRIEFRGVDFAYGPTSGRVLSGLDLSIRRGEKVAIVGPTGAGKSTLVKLLARFYDPIGGAVAIDGVDLRRARVPDVRKKLAVVLQDPYLIDGTIRENIAFGVDGEDEERLVDAARRSRAMHLIERLPDGWSARVGERGSRLSAGERQLVAFARALATDPEILILDEATSSIDPQTEALVQKGLEALLEDRTALIIAHRLSTIRRADRIIVLAAGRIVEEGTHEELVDRDGVYRKLYDLQFATA